MARRHIFLCCDQTKPKCCDRERGDKAWKFLKRRLKELGLADAGALGGTGGGIAYNREEFEQIVRNGLDLSPTHQVLVERSRDRVEGVRARGDARLTRTTS